VYNIFEKANMFCKAELGKVSSMYQQVFQLHAELLKAMSHPKRLEIIHLLRNQELVVTDIQHMLDLPQANLSQHLMVLRQARVVTTHKTGKQVYYRLSHHNFSKASDLLREILIGRYKNSGMADEFTYRMAELVPLTTDPVCGMRLSPKTAAYATHYHRQSYYFCAAGCRDRFLKQPGAFAI